MACKTIDWKKSGFRWFDDAADIPADYFEALFEEHTELSQTGIATCYRKGFHLRDSAGNAVNVDKLFSGGG